MNLDKLRGRIVEKRFTQEKISIELGLSLRSINRKLTRQNPFSNEEISKLRKLLNLTNDEVCEIFLD